MWDTIPLGTSYGLPCVLIYVFTDEFILVRRTTPLVGGVGFGPTQHDNNGFTDRPDSPTSAPSDIKASQWCSLPKLSRHSGDVGFQPMSLFRRYFIGRLSNSVYHSCCVIPAYSLTGLNNSGALSRIPRLRGTYIKFGMPPRIRTLTLQFWRLPCYRYTRDI